MKKIILSIDGMTCSACSNGLEKYLNKQNGVINANVNLVMANASIDYDEKILDQAKLEKFVKQAGFKSKGIFKEFKIEKQNKNEKTKFIAFTILAIILMYISMGHMANLPIFSIFDPHKNPISYTIILFVLTILFLIYGFDILRNGYKNLIHGIPNMDTLVTIGVISSFVYSLYGMYKILNGDNSYIMNLYFESSAIVIYFVKLGRFLDGINKDKTKEAIQKLVEITPNQATIEKNGVTKVVTLDEIKKGNILISKPGEKIAVDGEIVEGKAHFDESFITGESKPQMKEQGEKVIAGSLNYDGYVKYKAEKIGRESTVSEIVRLVIEASNTKAPIAKLSDKISGYFVPSVIAISVITFIVYLLMGFGMAESLSTFVTILVVACPCSLGLATPLAVVISEGVCVNNGILVKKSEILETASKIDTIVFDKTGTLTYGKLKVSKIYNYCSIENKELMQLVGSLESQSTHPIGKAFTDYLEENKISKLNINNFENLAGFGIIGEIEKNSNKKTDKRVDENYEKNKNDKSKKQIIKLMLGNRKLVEKNDIKNNHLDDEKELSKNGNSIIYVIKDKEIIALIGVNDIVRSEAKETIKKLNEKNIQTIMLTGDNKETAENIGKEIGITKVIANVLPSEKAETIKKLKQENKNVEEESKKLYEESSKEIKEDNAYENKKSDKKSKNPKQDYKKVMMCGDGINDSPALANSDIGVSVKSGTDIAMDSSDVILTKNDLNSILKLINISEKTVKNIKQNLFWAFFYNMLMIPIAMGVLKPIGISINPMIASLAMVFSSLTVMLNALRLRK